MAGRVLACKCADRPGLADEPHAWLTKVEIDADMIIWLYDKLDETMRDVAALCPWQDQPRRIIGVPCTECETEALADHGGDDAITCRSCAAVISRRPVRHLDPHARRGVMITITTNEAAAMLGITTAGVRRMVLRSTLTPVRPGAKPLTFVEQDVWALKRARTPPSERLRLAELAALWSLDVG